MVSHMLYYAGNKNLKAIGEKYKTLLMSVLNNEATNGANVGKLKSLNLYSVRIDQKARLIFTYMRHQGQRSLLILDYLENHDYQKRKFLKENVLTRFMEQNVQWDGSTLEFEAARLEAIPLEAETQVEFKPVHFTQHKIVFDDKQSQVLSAKKPLIIVGPPGCGKTSLSFALLIHELTHNNLDKVLYVTQSAGLVRQVRQD